MTVNVAELYAEHAPALTAYFLRRLPSDERGLAEDLTSVVFLNVMQTSVPYEDRGGSPVKWLFTIARHVLIDHHRAASIRPHSSPLDRLDRARVDAGSDRHADAVDVRDALATMDDQYREILTQRFLMGRRSWEIGEALGLTSNTVRKRQHRGLHVLRDQWARRAS